MEWDLNSLYFYADHLFVLILTTYIFWFEKIIFHIVSTAHHWHKEQSIGTAYIAQQSLRSFTQPCNQIRSYILWACMVGKVFYGPGDYEYATICPLSWFHMILSDSDLLGASCNVCPDPVLTSNITSSLAFLSASKCS